MNPFDSKIIWHTAEGKFQPPINTEVLVMLQDLTVCIGMRSHQPESKRTDGIFHRTGRIAIQWIFAGDNYEANIESVMLWAFLPELTEDQINTLNKINHE